MSDQLDKIIAFEQGELNDQGVAELFAELVESGTAWTLQGSYGRMAMSLIENGVLDKSGKITDSRFANREWYDGGEHKTK